jgi:hypothetical protein
MKIRILALVLISLFLFSSLPISIKAQSTEVRLEEMEPQTLRDFLTKEKILNDYSKQGL